MLVASSFPDSIRCSSSVFEPWFQENPQASKKEESESGDNCQARRQEGCLSSEQDKAASSPDGPQYTSSPASQEELDSAISEDDSEQEVDIEDDKTSYFNGPIQ